MSEQANQNVADLIHGLTVEAYGEQALEETAQEAVADTETADEANTQPDTQDAVLEAEPPVYATVLDEEMEIELSLPEVEDEPEYDEDDDDYDPRLAAEREKRRQLERELERTRRESARAQEEKWRSEATRVFPLMPESVRDRLISEAKSHRAFLRAAKEQHDVFVEVANRARKDVLDHLEQLREQAVAEGREEAQAAWGRPTTGDSPPRRAMEAAERASQRRGALSLADQIKERLAAGRR